MRSRRFCVQLQNPDGETQFIAISEAYDILSDPIKRTRYDAGGYDDADAQSGGGYR